MNPRRLVRAVVPALALSLLLVSVSFMLPVLEHPELPAPVAAVSASRIVSLTNEERLLAGVTRLERNALLDHAAQMKAEDMAAKGYYAHVSPEGITPVHFVERAGYPYLIVGENLVVQRTSAEQVLEAFMGSAGHRANILRRDFEEMGIGIAEGMYKGELTTFTVQIFGTQRARIASAEAKSSKENMKQKSNLPGPVRVPENPAVATVSRDDAPAPPAPSAQKPSIEDSFSVDSAGPIQEKVKILIKPIADSLQATSTLFALPETEATTTPFLFTPDFFLDAPVPLDPRDVSRLEVRTPPVPVGSVWTQQMSVMLEAFFNRARAFVGT